MNKLNLAIDNQWLERRFSVDESGRFQTVSLLNNINGHELLSGAGEEFRFVVLIKEFMFIMSSDKFLYHSHRYDQEDGNKILTVSLRLDTGENNQIIPSAVGEVKPIAGSLHVEIQYIAYGKHPVIRKKMRIRNEFPAEIRLQHLVWEDVELATGAGRFVSHRFFTEQSAAAEDNMDDSVMAVVWPEARDGVLIATEAPGAMKRLEVFKNRNSASVLYNNVEETLFEVYLNPDELFESDYCFFLGFVGKWEDAVDGPFRQFVEAELALCQPEDVPSFTMNTWETFHHDITEEIVLDNIKLASEMGFDAYQLDDGWFVGHGDFRPHPTKFPNGLEPIVEACRSHNIDLGLWMSVPNVHVDAPIAKEHPEWFLLDENDERGFMMGWQETHTMCLDSDYKYWILEQMDQVIKRYGVKLLKLDLASVRDPYNPGKSIGCHCKTHHHRTQKSSYMGIYRSLFWVMDELRRRNPGCLIDLTFELYGVLHGTDLAHIQHAHQNWIINQDTAWLDMLRRIIHTRSRVVPSYTLNFGSCHLTDELAKEYGFWSALTAHGLYYGDLRKLSLEDREHYRHWISWVKNYRNEVDFYRYYKVSDVFAAPDTPDHRDRRVDPYSFYEAGRITTNAMKWDGVAKLNEAGEGLVLLFRPGASEVDEHTFRLPWVETGASYTVSNMIQASQLGTFQGAYLHEGIVVKIPEAPGVAVLQININN